MTDIVEAASGSIELIEVASGTVEIVEIAVQGPPGVDADHSGLLNLESDDHLQYHTDARGDARYAALAHDHSGVYEPADADIQSHLISTANPHSVTAAQVGADATGTAAGLIATHEAALDPHPGYLTPAEGAAAYAPIAQGVTNGDSHDHSGGDGAQIAYSGLSGLPTLGTAAATASTDYATAAQGSTADSAMQPGDDAADLGSSTAADGYVLTADGSGGAAWEAVPDAYAGAASEIHAATEKTTPVNADELGLVDSAASWVLKRLTWANVKATLAGVFPLLAGKSGGQTLIGGTGVTDALTLQGTSANGTVTSTALQVKVGNNGALTALTVSNNGQLTIQGDATTDLPVYGSELLTSAGWTVNAGWTESPDDVFAHSSGTDTLTHSATITSGYKYQISWTVTGRTAGSFTVAVGGQSVAGQTATASFGPTATATTAFTITPTTDFNGTISLVSLKRITAASTPDQVMKNSAGTITCESRFVGGNVSIGTDAGAYLTTGSNNNCLGYNAGRSLTTGNNNNCLGFNAGRYQADGATALTDPEYSVYIGYGARGKDNSDNNSVVIGGNTPIGLGANTTVIGTSATILTRLFGNLGLGVDSPSASIHTIKTTEQLRLGYDATNYVSATVSAAGNLTFDTTGGTIYTPDTIENTVNGGGIVLRSPDGTRYLITVANGGTLTVATA